jgi:hypothetical protein
MLGPALCPHADDAPLLPVLGIVTASSSAASSQRHDPRPAKSASTPAKPTASSAAHRQTTGTSRSSSSDIHPSSLAHSKFPKINKTAPAATSTSSYRPSSAAASTTAHQRSKRPRSPSLSESPPPPPLKKRASSRPRHDGAGEMDISQEIWKLFGKDRRAYISRDVLSDDEDMEADATILEREEKMRSVLFIKCLHGIWMNSDLCAFDIVPVSRSEKRCWLWKTNAGTKRRNASARRRRSARWLAGAKTLYLLFGSAWLLILYRVCFARDLFLFLFLLFHHLYIRTLLPTGYIHR